MAHSVGAVVLDKTGTITEGKPHVTDLVDVGRVPICCSLPPLWRKIPSIRWPPLSWRRPKKQNLSLLPVEDFVSEPEKASGGRIKGKIYLAGNQKDHRGKRRGYQSPGAPRRPAGRGRQNPHVFAQDGQAIGIIAAADIIKPPAPRQWLSGRLWASTW